jgi:hypothetical protein
VHVLVDSTGLQVYGAGQWLEEKHGAGCRRSWRKLHLALNAESGEIIAHTMTGQDMSYASQVAPLLGKIDGPIGQFAADGAYDGKPIYDAIANHSADAAIVIPPRANAVELAGDGPSCQRDQHIAAINRDGRMKWQASTGYGKRALVETAIGRYKSIIGPRLQARSSRDQQMEVAMGCAVLNRMLACARPNSIRRKPKTTLANDIKDQDPPCSRSVHQRRATHVGCMAHARRRFVDALKARKKPGGPPAQALKFFDQLYRIERQVRDEKPDDGETRDHYMRRFRQKHSVPVLSALKEWLDKIAPKVVPDTKLGEAVSYTLNQWEYLTRYTEDGRMPIDNNILERDIRIFCTGRNSWLFSDTPAGAKASAVIYSLMLTCRACGVEPFAWLKYVLTVLPQRPDVANIDDLLPFNFKKQTA